MKKLFISQPMRGRTDDQILAERQKIIKTIKDTFNEEVVVLDSFFNFDRFPDEPEGCNHALFSLSKSLGLLAQADIVCFAPGWKKARGCKIEYDCAKAYGFKTYIQDEAERKCKHLIDAICCNGECSYYTKHPFEEYCLERCHHFVEEEA